MSAGQMATQKALTKAAPMVVRKAPLMAAQTVGTKVSRLVG